MTAAPKTLAEATTLLQDAQDARDALDRRFQAGDPPPPNEWSDALERVEYAKRAIVGLEKREQAESVVNARNKAIDLRKKYRKEVGKRLATVVAAQDGVAKAIETLVTAVAQANDKASSISGEVRALLPDHIPLDAPPDYLKNALKFGGAIPSRIQASHLIQSAAHDALKRYQASLTPKDVDVMRSLEGPPLEETKRIKALRERLEIVE